MDKFISEASRLFFIGGSAEAETELMAFDSALQACQIHNANILEVSSVIPHGADLVKNPDLEKLEKAIDPGDFLPVVISKQTSSIRGEKIYAAVAGCKFESGYGVNVELSGKDKDREKVKEEATEMLLNMAERRNEEITENVVFEYDSTEVEKTSCVISAVVYTLEKST